MYDLISRQEALKAVSWDTEAYMAINMLPPAEPETHEKHTETHACDLIYRQDAIDAVKKLLDSMLETDTIGFYEIENILFEVPSAQPEYEPVTAEDFAKTMSENSLYNFVTWHQEALTLMKEQGFVICKKTIL